MITSEKGEETSRNHAHVSKNEPNTGVVPYTSVTSMMVPNQLEDSRGSHIKLLGQPNLDDSKVALNKVNGSTLQEDSIIDFDRTLDMQQPDPAIANTQGNLGTVEPKAATSTNTQTMSLNDDYSQPSIVRV